ncbi:hypothetical protein I5535_17395 [Rhodobacteraceae bacterium F11138]|nr:hypothetical protein [Rhodobacteraceae bacterium F11138]
MPFDLFAWLPPCSFAGLAAQTATGFAFGKLFFTEWSNFYSGTEGTQDTAQTNRRARIITPRACAADPARAFCVPGTAAFAVFHDLADCDNRMFQSFRYRTVWQTFRHMPHHSIS